jgi:hypothetical protein
MASYNTRLGTWISEDVDRRLRLTAVLRKTRLNRLLDHLLDQALPSQSDLTAQMQGVAPDDAR